VRHPNNPDHFLISRWLAPDRVTQGDIVELDFDLSLDHLEIDASFTASASSMRDITGTARRQLNWGSTSTAVRDLYRK
jgi:hypothetical protein